MKAEVAQIIGKRIAGVIVKEFGRGGNPHSQVFLVFDDDTHYELYSDATICGAGGLDSGGMEKVRKYCTPPARIILDIEEAPSKAR